MSKSAFRAWFKEQYGDCPDIQKLKRLRRQHYELRDKLTAIENSMMRQERLNDLFNNTLYAWNAGRAPQESGEGK